MKIGISESMKMVTEQEFVNVVDFTEIDFTTCFGFFFVRYNLD